MFIVHFLTFNIVLKIISNANGNELENDEKSKYCLTFIRHVIPIKNLSIKQIMIFIITFSL